MPGWARAAGASLAAGVVVIATLLLTMGSTSAQGAKPLTLVTTNAAPEPAPAVVDVASPPAPEPVPAPAPAPEPAAARPEWTVRPAFEPEPAPEPEPVTVAAAPEPPLAGAAERCAAARQWVAAHGLVLPPGFAFRCPDAALFIDGASRWGTTCWNCGAPGGSYIAINIDRIGSSDDTLRYVVAHETCHAIQDVTTGVTSEESADACAAVHGASPP